MRRSHSPSSRPSAASPATPKPPVSHFLKICDQLETVDCPGGVVLSNAYDSLGRVTEIRWSGAGGGALKQFKYTYDGYDRISSITNETGGRVDYTYDSTFDWLTSETGYDSTGGVIHANTYGYDLVGNRLTNGINGVTNTYTLSTGNRLSTLSYNDAGCVTNMGRLSLSWDSQYQLTQASTGSVTKTYQYDALGRMVSTSDGSQTNWLVYQGAHVSAETDGSGNVLRSYTHGPGIDWPLAMNVYTGGVTNTYSYLTDHLGSVHAIVDAAASNIVESYSYDAYGNVSAFDGSGNAISASQIGNVYLFHGRRYDWDTGLYNFRARWYDPVTGRWLSNDPIGISGGLNQYVFCGDNPVNFIDPFGLSSADVAVMQRIFDETVTDWTERGQRHPIAIWNNNLGRRFGHHYLFCFEQFERMRLKFQQYDEEYGFDDEWDFTEISNSFLGVEYHWYGQATSSNPSDPVVTFDPFKNRFRAAGLFPPSAEWGMMNAGKAPRRNK